MLKRLVFVAFTGMTVAVLIWAVDFTTIVQAFMSMPRRTIAVLFALFLLLSVLKGLRWSYYLRAAELKVSWRDGLTSYLASMAAAPLPGGSWLAPRLVQEHGTVQMRQASPALFATFAGDAVAISVLAFAAFMMFGQPLYQYLIPCVGLAIGLTLVMMGRSRRVWNMVARLLNHWQFSRKWLPKERDVQQRVGKMMRAPVVATGSVISLLITIVSVMFFYLLVDALAVRDLTVSQGLYVHTASDTARIAIPVPGGFGITESSMAGLLRSIGYGLGAATFIALTVRSADLLLKAIVGSIVLVARYDRFLLASSLRDPAPAAEPSYAADIPGMRFVLQPALAAFAPFRRTSVPDVPPSLPVDESSLPIEIEEDEL